MKKTFKNLFISLLVLLFAFMLISCKPEPDNPPVPENNDEETKEEEQEKNSLAGRYIYKTPEEIILLSATEYGTGFFQAYEGNPEEGVYFLEAYIPLSFVYGENTITAIIDNEVFAILEYNPSTNELRDVKDETRILQPLDCPNNQVELNKDLIGKWEAAAPLEEGESGPSEKMIYEFTANGYLIIEIYNIQNNGIEVMEMSLMSPISGDDDKIIAFGGNSSSYVLSEDKNTLTLNTDDVEETLQLKKLSASLESIPFEGTYIAEEVGEDLEILVKDGLFILKDISLMAIIDITADQITLTDINIMDIIKVPYKYENDVFEYAGKELQKADLDILPIITSGMSFLSEIDGIDASERIRIKFDLSSINEDPEGKAEFEAICETEGIEPPTEYREDSYYAWVEVNDNGNESFNLMHGTYEVGEETITFIPYDTKNPVVVDYQLICGDNVPNIYMSLDGEYRLFSEPLL